MSAPPPSSHSPAAVITRRHLVHFQNRRRPRQRPKKKKKGISDLIYEATKPAAAEPDTLDDDLVNAWATCLGDNDGYNKPVMNRVNEFLLETTELEKDDVRSSGSSSPDSVGSVETSISSHFGGMNYPSLFSLKPSSYGSSQPTEIEINGLMGVYRGYLNLIAYSRRDQLQEDIGILPLIREEPPPYSSPVHQRYESFENPLAGPVSFGSHDEERPSSGNPSFGTALYDFTAGGDDELSITSAEEVEIEYEVDGWFYVKKRRPSRDGKTAGLVPVLYVNQS